MFRLFDLTMHLSGFPFKKSKAFLKTILSVPEKDYDLFLTAKKSEIVKFHLNNNSFYKDFTGNINAEHWEYVPVMKKIHLQQPLHERLSKGYSRKKVYINKTSGSSGNPFVFAKDKFCHGLIWAHIIFRFSWYNIDFNYSLQARFYGMPLAFLPKLKVRLKDFLSHRYRFDIFDLSDKGIEKIIHKFNTTSFVYINGYTSTIVLIAKYLKKRNLYLNTICPSLKVCIVTSEMLFAEDKLLLEERFRVPVINEYGAAELDIIAFENPDGLWKVNSETLFVEILDENNNVLPYGTEGRIVVTSLYNKAHPMIRYDVGDYGILDEKSTAKNPILKKLMGRTNDLAVLPSGKKAPGMTFYSITKQLFDDEGNVKEFLIKQTKTDTFEIEYVSENDFSQKEIRRLELVFTNYLEPGLHYIFIRKDSLERDKSGKLKQFRSFV